MSGVDKTTLTLVEEPTESGIRTRLGVSQDATSSRRCEYEQSQTRVTRHVLSSVTQVNARHSAEAAKRLTGIEDALKAERNERIGAQRALADAQLAIQQLQTRLAHTEIAAAEALATKEQELRSAHAKIEELVCALPYNAAVTSPAVKKRGRPLGGKQPLQPKGDPEPVKWWLPGYGAKKKG